jgi:hypothetical protein
VLRLYRKEYADLNVRHFYEELREAHGIDLSYTWVELALQGAGLVAKGRKRGVHRKRRARRPLPGMLLHLDGSRHQWFQDARWYDLIEALDDATSETYFAQLAEEESTRTVMAAAPTAAARRNFWVAPLARSSIKCRVSFGRHCSACEDAKRSRSTSASTVARYFSCCSSIKARRSLSNCWSD